MWNHLQDSVDYVESTVILDYLLRSLIMGAAPNSDVKAAFLFSGNSCQIDFWVMGLEPKPLIYQ